jgi:hypothetical protein
VRGGVAFQCGAPRRHGAQLAARRVCGGQRVAVPRLQLRVPLFQQRHVAFHVPATTHLSLMLLQQDTDTKKSD